MNDYELALLVIGDLELARRKLAMEVQRLQAEQNGDRTIEIPDREPVEGRKET